MKNKKQILVLLGLVFLILPVANADGIIIPRPFPDVQQIPPLSIKYHQVNISIDNQYAKTEIDQIFGNEFNRDLEGTYIFPLPDDASISEFSMFADNERLDGKILEKSKAREIYESIVRQLKDPALLEYAGRNTFTARVYPIPANGEKRIQLSYSEIIKCDNGICEYTYPLETEKFSSKPLKEVIISIKLSSKQAIKTIYSPTHKISIKRIGDYEAEVSYEENNIKPDKDFVLYWTVSEDDFGVNLLTYREKDKEGFFILLLSPRQEIAKEKILPKDIVFVLDTSGSMAGKKIEQAKNALKFIVNNLNEKDRFDIITFNTEIKKFEDRLVQVNSENRENALNFIDKIDAAGGTNIDDALLDSLKLFINEEKSAIDPGCSQKAEVNEVCSKVGYEFDSNEKKCAIVKGAGCIDRPPFGSLEECQKTCGNENSDSAKIIVFLTDGLPTVGVTETGRILGDVEGANKNKAKIFTFGVGYDVNTHLLDRISGQNKGTSEYVEPDEDIEIKVSGVYSKINSPVLSDVKLDFDGIEVYDIYPKEIPDMFKGSQLVVFGRYSGDGTITLKLTGKSLNKEKSYSYNLGFPKENVKNDFIPKLWASRKIGYLLDEIRLTGENKEIVDEIINLSIEYGIMTPYTSFLVDMDKNINRPAVREEARIMFNSIAAKSFSQTTGAGAVKTAQSMQEMQRSGISQDGSEKVKSIGVKTFYNKEGIWIDNEYAESGQVTELNYGSDDYFRLLNENPEFGKYLSIGKNVKFCSGERCFSIGERGGMEISTSTTIFSSPEAGDKRALVQAIAIVGLIILISFGVLLWGRRIR